VSLTHQSYEQYRTSSGYEWMMRIGDPRTPPILFIPPLFEEMNRTRALLAAVMRALALEGHGCWLPDLRGTGESPVALETVTFEDWRHDVAAAAEHVRQTAGKGPMVASLRGGALVDDAAVGACWWRFAPATGRALARDLDRASLTGGAEWGGYPASPELRRDLASAQPAEVAPLRLVRLDTDAADADGKVDGPSLWRRSEPGTSEALAAALAADLNQWSRSCAAS
jgi:pimeloyl-ACP methyl ester carboxylesterase